MAFFLNNSNLAELEKVFQLVDKDHGGTISEDEMNLLISTLGMKLTQHELEVIMQELDQDKKGEITFDAFSERMTRRVRTNVSLSSLKSAFARLLGPETQVVDFDDLVRILSTLGKPSKRLSKEEAAKLVSEITNVKKGKIELQILYDYLTN